MGDHVRVETIHLSRDGGFRLAAYPPAAVQMIDRWADAAGDYTDVLVIELPYVRYDQRITDTIRALEEFGATVLRPSPSPDGWPKLKAIDADFRQRLLTALREAVLEWRPWPPPGDGEAALVGINRARAVFAETLEIPPHVVIETDFDGALWYKVMNALHDLCECERRGEVQDKRVVLRQFLRAHVGMPKDTYKTADTGVYITFGNPPKEHHLRERVHLREGKPAETESVYWTTIGEVQSEYRYLIGRIGRHA